MNEAAASCGYQDQGEMSALLAAGNNMDDGVLRTRGCRRHAGSSIDFKPSGTAK